MNRVISEGDGQVCLNQKEGVRILKNRRLLNFREV